jgi:hypothetical protein
MPPTFFALPLRQMMLPFIGPLPVSSQNLPIQFLFFFYVGDRVSGALWVARTLERV